MSKPNKIEEDDKRKLLAEFSVWVAARYGLPVDERAVEQEIEQFMSEQGEGGLKAKAKMKKMVEDFKENYEEDEDTGYHG